MNEIEEFVKYIKENFNIEEIKLAKYIHDTGLLTYSMMTEKTIENGKEVEKPTNMLELSYLKMCAKNFDDSEDFLEKTFLTYIGYTLTEYRNTWRLNLNNLENSLKAKCTYCQTNTKNCPFKLIAYIKKCIEDNKFNSKNVFELLLPEEKAWISSIDRNAEEINIEDYITNNMDIIGAEMLLVSNSVRIEKIENEKIYYKYLDYNVKNNSFFENLDEYFNQNKGKEGVLSLTSFETKKKFSYIFDNSPIELAVYIKYFSAKQNIEEQAFINKILDERKFRESEFRISYYNQYVHIVEGLECNQKVKDDIISIFTYIRNYYFNEDLPYIHFNIALYTKNNILAEKIVNIINKYVRTFNYITTKPTLWIDSEMLVKRTKDSTDMLAQVDSMYSKNDILVFENIGAIKELNEYRVEALLTGIEKFHSKNTRSISIFIEKEEIFKDITIKHPAIESSIINKRIYIDGFDSKIITERVVKRLKNIMEIDQSFLEELDSYIAETYNQEIVDEYSYIEKLCNKIVFEKFNKLNIKNSFEKSDVPEKIETRDLKEIMDDINSLVGLAQVKENVNEILKYLEYSKKIDTVRIC